MEAKTYALKVRGTAGNLTREANLSLTVKAAGSGGSGGGGSGLGGQVELPPPRSGQGFPGQPPTAGPPSGGAALMGQDRLARVVVTPGILQVRPGEERYLAVWAEDDAGNRYAGDPSYLDLVVYNPAGYEVGWAGPGRIRVKAPGAFREEALVVNVRRKDRSPGLRYLNGVALVGMVELRPEVLAVPEELVGLPVGYELDQATLEARLALFTLEEWLRATRLEVQGEERPALPALVREDPSRGVVFREGQWIAGLGEASPLRGRVREVVARRNGYVLLSVEASLPEEVYARYQEMVDLETVRRAGVDLLEPLPEEPRPHGVRPQAAEDEECTIETKIAAQGKVGREGEGQLSLPLNSVVKCKDGLSVENRMVPSVRVTNFLQPGMSIDLSIEYVSEFALSLKSSPLRSLSFNKSLGRLKTPLGVSGLSLLIEMHLAGLNTLVQGAGEDVEILTASFKVINTFTAGYSGDSGWRFSFDPHAESHLSSPLGRLDGSLDIGRIKAKLQSDIAGVTVGLQVLDVSWVKTIVDSLAKKRTKDKDLGPGDYAAAGLYVTAYPFSTQMSYTYVSRAAALSGPPRSEEDLAGFRMQMAAKVAAGVSGLLKKVVPERFSSYSHTFRPYLQQEASLIPGHNLRVSRRGSQVRVEG
ncbi:hypothetical protein, partial [Thermus sp.]|uniref:hypothetical protein n=1 Tax=Thermus sp. TaxID=275 RepID=UPI003D0BD60C